MQASSSGWVLLYHKLPLYQVSSCSVSSIYSMPSDGPSSSGSLSSFSACTPTLKSLKHKEHWENHTWKLKIEEWIWQLSSFRTSKLSKCTLGKRSSWNWLEKEEMTSSRYWLKYRDLAWLVRPFCTSFHLFYRQLLLQEPFTIEGRLN
jgi:hypothetical protein